MTLKAGICERKTGDFEVINGHKSKRILKKRRFDAVVFNIRYTLIFQIEKKFCPDFLPFRHNVLTFLLYRKGNVISIIKIYNKLYLVQTSFAYRPLSLI